MVLGVVALSNVVYFKDTVVVAVHFIESLLDQLLPGWVHLPFNCLNELIKIENSVIIHIEKVEETPTFILTELQPEIT